MIFYWNYKNYWKNMRIQLNEIPVSPPYEVYSISADPHSGRACGNNRYSLNPCSPNATILKNNVLHIASNPLGRSQAIRSLVEPCVQLVYGNNPLPPGDPIFSLNLRLWLGYGSLMVGLWFPHGSLMVGLWLG